MDAPGSPPSSGRPGLIVTGRTDVGRIRTRNEDALAVEPESGLAVVADGMGGHPGGDVASRLAVETVVGRLRPVFGPPGGNGDPGPGEAMRGAVEEANRKILEAGRDDPTLEGMGTTVTAFAFERGARAAWLGHVGDSRAYVLRGGALRTLTRDDTWVQEQVDAGVLSPEAARTHPMSHLLTHALGIGSAVDVQIVREEVRPGDVFLLCSDGLTAMLPDEEIEEIVAGADVAEPDSLDHAAERLVETANRHGGRDNVTVALVGVLPE